MEEVDVTAGLKPGGLVVLNTPRSLERSQLDGFRVAVADVTAIATETGLRKGVVNTGIIGAFSKASGLVGIDILGDCIEKEFAQKKGHENAECARVTYERTLVSNGVQQ